MAKVIRFEDGGRKYEAVSFLNAGEKSVDGDTMIARTDAENGGGLGQEEGGLLWEHRWEHRAAWPEELKRHHLVFTKWCSPVVPRLVRYFYWCGDRWDRDWNYLRRQWDGRCLVVRRRT